MISVGSYLVSSAWFVACFVAAFALSFQLKACIQNVPGNKLQLESHIDVREENKKARGKKITGLHVSMMVTVCLCILDMFFSC